MDVPLRPNSFLIKNMHVQINSEDSTLSRFNRFLAYRIGIDSTISGIDHLHVIAAPQHKMAALLQFRCFIITSEEERPNLVTLATATKR